MAVPANVPTITTPEATERVDELGMQGELEQVLEHTRQTTSDHLHINVRLEPCYDTRDETGITIEVARRQPVGVEDPAENELGLWLARTFPREVCQHFAMLDHFEAPDARNGLLLKTTRKRS